MKDDFKLDKTPPYITTCPYGRISCADPGLDPSRLLCLRCLEDWRANNHVQPPYAPIEIHKANAGMKDITPEDARFLRSFTNTEQGIKYDAGKPDLSLVSSEIMEALARVRHWAITAKPKPYPRDNWKRGFKYTRSIAAALRHIMAFKDGEDNDPESGEPHIAHAIACLEHLLYDYKHHKANDDRGDE